MLAEYEEVLKINPGNIVALAAQGYVLWLLGGADNAKLAKKKFETGLEFKDIVRETFVGELNYGLARIAAEEGAFEESYALYTQAIADRRRRIFRFGKRKAAGSL